MQRSIKVSYRRFFTLVVLLIMAVPMLLQAQGKPSISSEEPSGKIADASTSGTLFDELAHMDELIFTASFITCDAKKINALMTDDIEFYHDLTGFNSGQRVRDNNANLTKNCPGKRGLSRRLVKGSLRVYPIKDYGAIQMGTHVFMEENSSTTTIAKFVHLWKKVDGGKKENRGTKTAEEWKISRVLSFDHVSVESAAGALLQRVE